jgi:hypothetical protein
VRYRSNMGSREVLWITAGECRAEHATRMCFRISEAACGASQQIQCAGALNRPDTVVCVELGIDVLDMGARGVR